MIPPVTFARRSSAIRNLFNESGSCTSTGAHHPLRGFPRHSGRSSTTETVGFECVGMVSKRVRENGRTRALPHSPQGVKRSIWWNILPAYRRQDVQPFFIVKIVSSADHDAIDGNDIAGLTASPGRLGGGSIPFVPGEESEKIIVA